jgi:hypothetical protein
VSDNTDPGQTLWDRAEEVLQFFTAKERELMRAHEDDVFVIMFRVAVEAMIVAVGDHNRELISRIKDPETQTLIRELAEKVYAHAQEILRISHVSRADIIAGQS